MIRKFKKKTNRGAAMIVVVLLCALFLIAVVGMLYRSSRSIDMANLSSDRVGTEEGMKGDLETARNIMARWAEAVNDWLALGDDAVAGTLGAISLSSQVGPAGAAQFFNQAIRPLAVLNNQAASFEMLDQNNAVTTVLADIRSIRMTGGVNGRHAITNQDCLNNNGTIDDCRVSRNSFSLRLIPKSSISRPQANGDGPEVTFEYGYEIQIFAQDENRNFAGGQGESKINIQATERGRFEIVMKMNPSLSQWGTVRVNSTSTLGNGVGSYRGKSTSLNGGSGAGLDREIFSGKFHHNAKSIVGTIAAPQALGSPLFLGSVHSVDINPLNEAEFFDVTNASGHDGAPVVTGQLENISNANLDLFRRDNLPSRIDNILRLAAGDDDIRGAGERAPEVDLRPVDGRDLVNNTQLIANGRLAAWLGQDPTQPNKIFVPTTLSSGQPVPKAGIFVNGNVKKMRLRVLRPEDRASQVRPAHAAALTSFNCNVQMIQIETETERQTHYVTDDRCTGANQANKTMIIRESRLSASDAWVEDPSVQHLHNKFNGQIYVNGNIENLSNENETVDSGSSYVRQAPAVLKDFKINIGAAQDVQISSDLQYEDAKYYEVDPDVNHFERGDIVADNPWNSDITQANLRPEVAHGSETLLGIVSERNVVIRPPIPFENATDAGQRDLNLAALRARIENINLHALIFAGVNVNDVPGGTAAENAIADAIMRDPLPGTFANPSIPLNGTDTSTINPSTGRPMKYSCCGFGFPYSNIVAAGSPINIPAQSGLGTLKILGSVTEWLSWLAARPSAAGNFSGFVRRYYWDTRLRDLRLPGFPASQLATVSYQITPVTTVDIAASK